MSLHFICSCCRAARTARVACGGGSIPRPTWEKDPCKAGQCELIPWDKQISDDRRMAHVDGAGCYRVGGDVTALDNNRAADVKPGGGPLQGFCVYLLKTGTLGMRVYLGRICKESSMVAVNIGFLCLFLSVSVVISRSRSVGYAADMKLNIFGVFLWSGACLCVYCVYCPVCPLITLPLQVGSSIMPGLALTPRRQSVLVLSTCPTTCSTC